MRRNQTRDPSLFAEALQDWSTWPSEAQIGSLALPAFLMFCAHLIAMVPSMQEFAGEDTILAGGLISSILVVILFKLTFGAHVAREKAQRKRSSGRAAHHARVDALTELEAPAEAVHHHHDSIKEQMRRLSHHDPAFSEVLLHQYLRGLLVKLHGASSPKQRAALAPYAVPSAWVGLERAFAGADQVVATAPVITGLNETRAWTQVQVSMQAIAHQDGQARPFRIQWNMRRSGAARSVGPADVLTLQCPACGAPVEPVHPDGHCKYCNLGILHGQQSWQIMDVTGNPDAPSLAPIARPDDGGDHRTTLPPTLEDRSLDRDLRSLSGRHPEFVQRAFEIHAGRVCAALYTALASGDTQALPSLLSPDLLQAVQAQIDIDRAGALTRQGGPVHIDQLEWSSIGGDGWYEVVAIRVFATLPWCITDDEDTVLDGNPEVTRTLSRYLFFQHPVGQTLQLNQWRLWKVATPDEYAA